MARLPRYHIIYDGCTFHVTWQCHNKDWLLKSDEAKQIYYDLLLKYKDKYGVRIYSYNFMSNHPHLSGAMSSKEEFSNFFRVVNNLFARKYNRIHKRCGQVVMDRFRSPVIQGDNDLLRVMVYIDLNPIRAGMVKHPRQYRWTSYHHYAHGERNQLIDPAPSYLTLGDTAEKRQLAYRTIVEEILMSGRAVKQNYSAMDFIGDPDWVLKKKDALRSLICRKQNHHQTTAPPTS